MGWLSWILHGHFYDGKMGDSYSPINSMQLRCHLVLGPSVLHPPAGSLVFTKK